MKKSIAIALMSALMLFTACQKGETGPQGDKGDQGTPGAKGDPGPSAKHVDVTANFDGTSSWVSFPIYQNGYNDGDAVFVYYKNPDSNNWLTLTPYIKTSSPSAYFWSQVTSVSLFVYAQDPNSNSQYTPAFKTPTTSLFRVVMIKASPARYSVNFSDYQAVKKAFNLPD